MSIKKHKKFLLSSFAIEHSELGAKYGLYKEVKDKYGNTVTDANGDGKITKQEITTSELITESKARQNNMSPQEYVDNEKRKKAGEPEVPQLPVKPEGPSHGIFKDFNPQRLQLIEEQYKTEMKQYEADLNAYTAYYANKTSKSIAEKTANAQEHAATAQVKVAKLQQDPTIISQTEMEVFNIVKKYDFLKDPEAFKTLVNNSTDNSIKADALALEKDLAKLGMNLKVDGKIDDNTITAVEGLISKNAQAIKAYEEVTGVSPIKKPNMER